MVDFRTNLMELYQNSGLEVKNFKSLKFVNDRPIFNGNYYSPDDIVIFHGTGYDIGIAEFLAKNGYIVDETKLSKAITECKPLLFSILRDHNYPVENLFSEEPDSEYNIGYTSAGASVMCKGECNYFNCYAPWDGPYIEGYLMFFYLYELSVYAKVIWESNSALIYHLPNSSVEPIDVNMKFGKQLSDIARALPDISDSFVEQIKKALIKINAASAEVLVGINNANKLRIIDINNHHYPIARRILEKYNKKAHKDFFMTKISNTFIDVMGLNVDPI